MHIQRGPATCGPDCLGVVAEKFGITQQQVDKAYNCTDINNFKDLQDTPANLESAMCDLNLNYRIVDANQILNGECKNGNTIILIHSNDDPATWWNESWGIQHWTILWRVYEGDEYTPAYIELDFGTPDMKAKHFTHANFMKIYNQGGPTNTAYEILGILPAKVPAKWYYRLWSWLTSWLSKF
jgi:hypothetical protein